MDRWGKSKSTLFIVLHYPIEVDVVYTATQKALGCPPGLAPISFSERAK